MALRVENVSVRFATAQGPEVVALDKVSLAVEDSQFSAIVGPSGCGKSTLLRMAAGLQEETEGRIELDGARIRGPSADRGMVFQSYTLFPWLTVARNIEFGPMLRGVPRAERGRIAAGLVERVGLAGFEDAWPEQLSGGMRQRAALARALANDPKILLMDEPFGALDSLTRRLMQELLLDVWERDRKTVLFVTHDIDEAIFLADIVHVMSARPGRIERSLPIGIPRPRRPETLTSAGFTAYKREILDLMHGRAAAEKISEKPPAGV